MAGIKLKVLPNFPAQLIGGVGLRLTKANGIYTLDLDYSEFSVVGSPPANTYALIYDPVAKTYVLAPPGSVGATPSDVNPLMDGVAAPGVSALYSRGDHVHPTDTSRAPLASPTFTGDPKAPTPAPGDNDTSIATTAFIVAALALYAPLASPTFTGDPKAPTPTAGDNDTSIATTAFVTGAIREKLTANRNYFVNASTGNDSNTGLSSGAAFATVQKAIDTAAALDSAIYDVTITCVGTFANGAGLTGKSMVGAGRIILVGDEVTPANVTFNNATSGAIGFNVAYCTTIYELRGIKWVGPNAGAPFTWQAQGCLLRFQNCEIGSGWLQQVRSIDGATIASTGGFLIVSAAPMNTGLTFTTVNGTIRLAPAGCNIQLPNALAYTGAGSAFAASSSSGFLIASNGVVTITGAGVAGTTGQRYLAQFLGLIRTDGGGANFFPGSVAGTPAPTTLGTDGAYYN